MKRIAWGLIVAMTILSLTACNGTVPLESDEAQRIIVAVGIVPAAAFVERVAGDLVEVVTMIPPGNSPANYQPTAQQMQQVSDAALYFTLHMPTEDANILPKLTDFNRDIRVVDLRDAVSAVYPMLSANHQHDGDETEAHDQASGSDPHIWLSPKRAMVMVQAIANELSAMDEANRETYQTNAQRYIKELELIDQEIRQKFENLTNRSFLIYHAAYTYFADDYDLTMISIEIEGKQATAQELQQAIEYAKQNGITSVFYQEEFNDSQANTVAQEIGGTVTAVAPLSADYIESLRHVADALLNAQ